MKYNINKIVLLSLSLLAVGNTYAQEAEDKKEVALAHRTVDAQDLVGSVSTIDYEELNGISQNFSTYDVTSAMVGGWTTGQLWGNSNFLVLVDGFPRENYSVLPSEIKSISFLKGASAAVLYGSTKAINGVVLITTKRGDETTPLKITATANTGMNFAKETPEYLGSAEYMDYYNMARRNDGLTDLYTAADIYNYASGDNIYRYPNVDLYSSDYLKNYYNRTDATVEVSGSNDKTRYYSNVSYLHQGDYLNFGEATKNGINRLSVRGNIDMDIAERVTAYANTSVILYDSRTANSDYWSAARSFRPNRIAPLVPVSMVDAASQGVLDMLAATENIVEGSYFLGGSQTDMTNVIADYYVGGNSKNVTRTFQFDAGVNYDMSNVTPGLMFRSNVGVDYASGYNLSYSNQYSVYQPIWSNMNGDDSIIALEKFGTDKRTGNQNASNSWMNRTMQGNVKFDYNRSFGLHNVTSMLLASGTQATIAGQYHKPSSANLGFQATYNYNHKYYAEFTAALAHSAKLAKGNRAGFSPSVTVGWNIARESFLENSVVDDLMLSASASSIKSDIVINDYYAHYGVYTNKGGGGYNWGDGAYIDATYPTKGANPDLTYISRDEVSVNLRGSLFGKKLNFDASAFVSNMNGGLASSTELYPSYFVSYWPASSMIPMINYNEDLRKGIDFNVNYNAKVGEVKLNVGVVGSYITRFATKRLENYEYDYQNRQGKALDAIWGLESAGFYSSESDVVDYAATPSFGEVQAGDIKYVDQNGDNIIDSKDEVVLGNWDSPLNMGLNFTANWRGLTLFVAATAQFGGEAIKNSTYDWVYGDRKYSAVVRDCWTVKTADTATYPRLTTQSGDNNFRSSDFWIYSTDRIDISKVQLTYDFPKSWFNGKVVKSLSTYVGGYNLLTISAEKERMETNYNGAPYSRLVNLGVNLSF